MCKQRKTILRLITLVLLYLLFSLTTLTVKAEEKLDTEETLENTENVSTEITDESLDNTETDATEIASTIYDLSPEVIAYCKIASKEFNFNEFILESLIFTESRGYSEAKNGSFVGLTQLKPKYFETTMTLLNIEDPTNPLDNVRLCAYTLSNWYEKYDNNMYLILDCWHKGEGKAVAQHTSKGTSYSRTICNNAILLEAQNNLANNPETKHTDENFIAPKDDTTM